MQSTAEAGTSLLLALSDDELARYGEIARDQAKAELSTWWMDAVLAIAAPGIMLAALGQWGWSGFERLDAAEPGIGRATALGFLALALAYRPYRRLRNWTLWNRHCKAVLNEQERRAAPQRG